MLSVAYNRIYLIPFLQETLKVEPIFVLVLVFVLDFQRESTIHCPSPDVFILVGWGMGVVVPGNVGCRDRGFQIPRTRFSPSSNFQWNPTILNF